MGQREGKRNQSFKFRKLFVLSKLVGKTPQHLYSCQNCFPDLNSFPPNCQHFCFPSVYNFIYGPQKKLGSVVSYVFQCFSFQVGGQNKKGIENEESSLMALCLILYHWPFDLLMKFCLRHFSPLKCKFHRLKYCLVVKRSRKLSGRREWSHLRTDTETEAQGNCMICGGSCCQLMTAYGD